MHQFHDCKTGFTLDYSGFAPLADLSSIESRYKYAIERILTNIQATETGKPQLLLHLNRKTGKSITSTIASKTRWEKITFHQKSLQRSLDYNQKVLADVSSILQGGKSSEGHVFTDVVFNGIGGSFLGPLMLIISQLGENFNHNLPLKIHFVSNSDPESFALLFNQLSLESTLCVHMSKSGSTAETAGNLDAFVSMLEKAGLDVGCRNCAITTPGSPFDKKAQKRSIDSSGTCMIFFIYF
ncbi:hypothetical protein GEMRC1_007375 [Eukaryota sp. GEM-RC1]